MKLVFISLIILKLHPLIYRIIIQATMPMVLFLQFFCHDWSKWMVNEKRLTLGVVGQVTLFQSRNFSVFCRLIVTAADRRHFSVFCWVIVIAIVTDHCPRKLSHWIRDRHYQSFYSRKSEKEESRISDIDKFDFQERRHFNLS